MTTDADRLPAIVAAWLTSARERTHYEGCDTGHAECAIRWLAKQLEAAWAELALWRKATGRDDAERLDFELGRAGIDTHLQVLAELREAALVKVAGLEAERDQLREALKPLADYIADGRRSLCDDDQEIGGGFCKGVTIGHCRRARALLEGKP